MGGFVLFRGAGDWSTSIQFAHGWRSSPEGNALAEVQADAQEGERPSATAMIV
jgi:hypothetical protein